MIVDSLPGAVFAARGLAALSPPAKAAVQIPGVHVRQDHPEAVLQQVRRFRPVAAAPGLDDVNLRIEVHHDVRPLGQRRAP